MSFICLLLEINKNKKKKKKLIKAHVKQFGKIMTICAMKEMNYRTQHKLQTTADFTKQEMAEKNLEKNLYTTTTIKNCIYYCLLLLGDALKDNNK